MGARMVPAQDEKVLERRAGEPPPANPMGRQWLGNRAVSEINHPPSEVPPHGVAWVVTGRQQGEKHPTSYGHMRAVGHQDVADDSEDAADPRRLSSLRQTRQARNEQ
uniref:Uncharacterized protein n=1 Tax=Knipowitschia caucasica TaxID=637954 RepID=A0AAV2LEM0_KNICA